ncbi:hypothetical protein D3C78_1958890 [compost metagenome]
MDEIRAKVQELHRIIHDTDLYRKIGCTFAAILFFALTFERKVALLQQFCTTAVISDYKKYRIFDI